MATARPPTTADASSVWTRPPRSANIPITAATVARARRLERADPCHAPLADHDRVRLGLCRVAHRKGRESHDEGQHCTAKSEHDGASLGRGPDRAPYDRPSDEKS